MFIESKFIINFTRRLSRIIHDWSLLGLFSTIGLVSSFLKSHMCYHEVNVLGCFIVCFQQERNSFAFIYQEIIIYIVIITFDRSDNIVIKFVDIITYLFELIVIIFIVKLFTSHLFFLNNTNVFIYYTWYYDSLKLLLLAFYLPTIEVNLSSHQFLGLNLG